MIKTITGYLLGFFALLPCAPAAEPHFVDLSPIATTSLENNGQEGWSNEGINDMFLYPPIPSGEVTRNGYRFKLPQPKHTLDKTVVMLRGKSLPDKPTEATAEVPSVKGRFVYFLQNSVRAVADQPKNYRIAVYTVNYADGTKSEIPI